VTGRRDRSNMESSGGRVRFSRTIGNSLAVSPQSSLRKYQFRVLIITKMQLHGVGAKQYGSSVHLVKVPYASSSL
jgi:hypothetical protein